MLTDGLPPGQNPWRIAAPAIGLREELQLHFIHLVVFDSDFASFRLSSRTTELNRFLDYLILHDTLTDKTTSTRRRHAIDRRTHPEFPLLHQPIEGSRIRSPRCVLHMGLKRTDTTLPNELD